MRDGTLSLTDPAGILFPADLAEPTTVGVVGLTDAGILFLVVSEGILFPPDHAGILFPAVSEGILFPPDHAGILFPAVSEGILFPPDSAGMPFPADQAKPVTIGVTSLADAGILFTAVSEGILFPPDSAGMPFPADQAKPVTVGVTSLADAGILFTAVSEGILFPHDPAGKPFLAEPVTVGVTGLGDAGILFPAVYEGIPVPTDPGKLLSPADHVEPCAVVVTELDELSELGTFTRKMEAEEQYPLCCHVGDGVDFWHPVMMVKELGCRVDKLPVYYGGDLWNPDGSDFGYSVL